MSAWSKNNNCPQFIQLSPIVSRNLFYLIFIVICNLIFHIVSHLIGCQIPTTFGPHQFLLSFPYLHLVLWQLQPKQPGPFILRDSLQNKNLKRKLMNSFLWIVWSKFSLYIKKQKIKIAHCSFCTVPLSNVMYYFLLFL